MTVVALVLVPVVLLYQGWTYYVFRHRITGEEVEGPVELIGRKTGG
jgi:cytochrome d ubiquinol oxidase subunit II